MYIGRPAYRAIRPLVVVTALLCMGAAHGAQKHALWRVATGSATVYLQGTVHILPDAEAYLAPETLKVLQASERLVLEVDLQSTSNSLSSSALEQSLYPAGETIADHVRPETLKMLRDCCSKLGLASRVLEQMQPWGAAMYLTLIQLTRNGYKAANGTEHQLLEQAHKMASPPQVEGLETVQFQLSLLQELAKEDPDALLAQAIESNASLDELLAPLVKAWRGGDEEELATLLTTSFGDYPRLHAALVTTRNRTWTAQIERMLAGDGTTLIAVGCAHLVGTDGILQELKAKGYKVEQL